MHFRYQANACGLLLDWASLPGKLHIEYRGPQWHLYNYMMDTTYKLLFVLTLSLPGFFFIYLSICSRACRRYSHCKKMFMWVVVLAMGHIRHVGSGTDDLG